MWGDLPPPLDGAPLGYGSQQLLRLRPVASSELPSAQHRARNRWASAADGGHRGQAPPSARFAVQPGCGSGDSAGPKESYASGRGLRPRQPLPPNADPFTQDLELIRQRRLSTPVETEQKRPARPQFVTRAVSHSCSPLLRASSGTRRATGFQGSVPGVRLPTVSQSNLK